MLILIITFGSFAWSVKGLFKSNKHKNNLHYRFLQIISITVWSWFIYQAYTSKIDFDFKYALFALTQILCLISFWYLRNLIRSESFGLIFNNLTPKRVFQGGLFRFIRHPFYTTYIVSYGACALYFQDITSIVLWILVSLLYIKASFIEETLILQTEIGDQYLKYRDQAGRFFPKFGFRKRNSQT